MKKISTLYKKNPENLGLVINEIDPENEWVFNEDSIATVKFDGTATAIIDGEIYKRYDAKKGKSIPEGAIPCQDADLISGHHPHWLKCERNKKEDKYFFEAFDKQKKWLKDGTYELCGTKINGNKEKLDYHILIKHGCVTIPISDFKSFDFNGLKDFLYDTDNDIEGIVFHHKKDGRMCKLRKSDFGIKR